MPNGRCSCGQYAPCDSSYCDFNRSAFAIEYKPVEPFINIFPSYSPPKNTDASENDNTLHDALAMRRAAEEAAAKAENLRKLRESMLTTIELKQNLGQALTVEERDLLKQIESERAAQYADIDINPKAFLYAFLGFMGLIGVAGILDYKKEPLRQGTKSAPVTALTKINTNIYGQNKVQIGVLNEDSCIVARPPFQYDSNGFLRVEVNTSKGIVYGNVDKFLLYKSTNTAENCHAEIRKVSPDPKSGLVTMVAKANEYIYGQNNVKLGVLGKDSCVLAQPPLRETNGLQSVTVNTAQGTIQASVSARILSVEKERTVESCKAEIRRPFADSSKPETKDLPKAQTYLAPKGTPLYFGTATPPSGLYADAGSCVILMSSGHTDKMFHVMVSGQKRRGDAYVSKDAVVPIGDYDWDKGCNAYISGTVINHRPKAPAEPPASTKTPESKAPEIHGGDLYVVTADRTDLRSGPGANFGALNTIFKGSCVQATGGKNDKDGFVQVLTSYDQKHYQKGYVSRDSLKPTPQGLGKMECFIR